MAKTFTAPFPQSPKTKTAVATLACTIADDAPANTVELLTAGAEGTIVTKLTAIPRATTGAASLLALFVVKSGDTAKRLVGTALLPATTVNANSALAPVSFGYAENAPLRLEAGDKLFVGSMVALASGIVFTSQHTDY